MKLTKQEIRDIQNVLKKERELMINYSIAYEGDYEDDKCVSLMYDNKANQISELIEKLNEILKYNELSKSINSFNKSINSDNNINEDFRNLFI